LQLNDKFYANQLQNLLLFVRIAIVQIRRYSICPEFVVYAEKAE
jgi:hypothetical protein